jgi:transcriptional regulator with XRE-family HTH domain
MEMFKRIRYYIEDNGIVIRKVAERSGIGEKKFYRLVNGQSKLHVDDYEKICRDGLGLHPGYFFEENVSKTESTLVYNNV